MRLQSNAHHRLVALHRVVLRRMHLAREEAYRAFLRRIPLRLHVELLPPRLMFSITASGSETVVDAASTTHDQTPAVAMSGNGSSVVAWSTGDSGGMVFAQRYDATGAAVGGAITVNAQGAGGNALPSAAMDQNGDFVVVWNSGGNTIYSRLFNSAGTAVTGDTLVTSTKTGPASANSVAMSNGGAFGVVWEGNFGSADNDGICSRQFDNSGLASGGVRLVNTTTNGAQQNPSIAVDSSGDAAIAWTDRSSGQIIKAAYWPAGGSPSSEITVAGGSPQQLDHADVSFLAPGDFVVAYEDNKGNGTISARRYAGVAAIDSIAFQVSASSGKDPVGASVAGRSDGSFLVTWSSDSTGSGVQAGSDGNGKGVFAQAYTSAGATDGAEFQVNIASQHDQQTPSVAWSGNTAVIAYDSNADSAPTGILQRRFTTTGGTNQSPTLTLPGAQSTTQDVPITFSTSNGNAVSVADVDANGAAEQFSLTAAHGVVSLSRTAGLTFSTGTGSNDASAVFTGTLANINAALSGMTLTPAAGFTGTASLQLSVNDLGNSGSGGAKNASGLVNVNVGPTPTSTRVPPAQTLYKNSTLTFSPANGNPIYIGNGWNYIDLQVTNGTLTLATTSGLTFSIGTGANDAHMQFGGSVSAMNAALDGLVFTPAFNFTGSASITLQTSNNGVLGLGVLATSATNTINATVAPTPNQAPVLTVPTARSTPQGTPLVLSSNSAIAVADADANGNVEAVTLSATSGTISLASISGLSFSAGTGTADASESFTGTLASINAALNGMTFTPAAQFYGTGGVVITVNDQGNTGAGGAKSATGAVSIDVTEVNQPPAVSLPGAQTAINTGPLNFSAATGNAITVSDTDSNGAIERLSLSTTAGTLTLNLTNLTVVAGANGSSSLSVTGTLADLHAALDGLTLTPANGFTGSATIAVGINDLGNTGAGGAMSASGTVSVTFVSTLVVTTNADVVDGDTSSIDALLTRSGGAISLREAILAADNTTGQHTIAFDIPGGGVQTISLAASLPQITTSTTIDATTQPGYFSRPMVELDGQGAPFGAIGLSIAASYCTIRGLAVYGFSGNGIDVLPVGANHIIIQGNYVGLNAGGAAVYNGDGIVLASSSNDLVGGASFAQRNVISGNYYEGVHVYGAGSSSDQIVGNYIGVAPDGITPLGNGRVGIFIDGASNNIVGLASAGGGNIISGNGSYGIEVGGSSPSGNVIQNNTVGLDASGVNAVGNARDGIYLLGASNTLIGGSVAGARNVISGNDNVSSLADGVWISGGSSNFVLGNFIGPNASLSASPGNAEAGVRIENSSQNLVGSLAAPNIIAFNDKGIVVAGASSVGNTFNANSIYGNRTLGIDLGDDGIDLNNGAPSASRPNRGMNFPVFTTAALSGSTLSVRGYVGSAAGQGAFGGAVIDLYVSDVSQANGQGRTFLGAVTADSSGNFDASLSTIGLTLGNQVTATATDAQGDTSEFAVNTVVMSPNQPPTLAAPPSQQTGENAATTFSSAGANAITISDADSNGGVEQISLSTASGILTLAQTGNVTFVNGTQNASGLLTFTGTLAALNAALDGLVFTPAQDFSGTTSLSVSADDLGHTGGNHLTVSTAIALRVLPVAHAPTISDARTNDNAQTTSGLVITPSTLDGTAQAYYQITHIIGGTVYLNDGVTPVADGQFVTFAQGAAGLKFTPYGGGAHRFDVQTSTTAVGGLVDSTVVAHVFISRIAHTPTISSATAAENQQTTSGLVITADPNDSGDWYRITRIVGGRLFQNDGVTPIHDGDFITAGQGAAGLKFTPAANSTAAGAFNVQASTSAVAAGLGGSVVQASISVTPAAPAPLAPIANVPPTQSGAEDTPLLFSRAGGNAITVSDPGSAGSAEQVTLSTPDGTLTLGSRDGITLVSGTGANDTAVTFRGDLASVNAALDGLLYHPTSHYNGAASIRIIAKNLSYTGSDSAATSTNAVGVAIAPSSAAPSDPLPIITPHPTPVVAPPASSTVTPLAPQAPANAGLTSGTSSSSPDAGGVVSGSSTPPETPGSDERSRPSTSSPTALPVLRAAVAPVVARAAAQAGINVRVGALPDPPRADDLGIAGLGPIDGSRSAYGANELLGPVAANALPNGLLMAARSRAASSLSAQKAAAAQQGTPLWRDLDNVEEQLKSRQRGRVVAGAASMVSVGMSVAYFMWAVRAGSVLSSLLSSMPAWKLVDPLPILDQMAGGRMRRRNAAGEEEEDDESLESMVQGENALN